MPPPYYIHPFVKVLAEKRKSDGLSILELSERSGYSTNHLAHLECGQRKPSMSMLTAWADTLGLEVIVRLKNEETK